MKKTKRIKHIKLRDILALIQFILVFPIALIAKIFIKDFWLICEDRMEARDNGYWLFKYIREKYPKQKIAYAIDRRSVDYEKVRNLGKTIQFGSWTHWFWYLTANKNISSQKDGKPNDLICQLIEIVIPIWRNKRCFLQHGITKDDAKWLHYEKCKFSLFVCGAKPEVEFVKKTLHYPDQTVKYLGFARFDQLHNVRTDKNLIIVMPTWRGWIANDLACPDDFIKTEFFRQWNSFLNDIRLEKLLEQYHKRLLFFPHRNMQKFLMYFSAKSKNIEIAGSEKYDIQELLKKSSLMITDYSSVFFDFAYMKKPVIFYQFDEIEFREKHYQQGYFDYHNNSLGYWTDRIEKLLQILEEQMKANFPENNNINEFFEIYDNKNCERIYRQICIT